MNNKCRPLFYHNGLCKLNCLFFSFVDSWHLHPQAVVGIEAHLKVTTHEKKPFGYYTNDQRRKRTTNKREQRERKAIREGEEWRIDMLERERVFYAARNKRLLHQQIQQREIEVNNRQEVQQTPFLPLCIENT